MDERSKIFRVLLTLSLVLFAHEVCKAEIVSPARLTITDVIPGAFSVVWSVSEPATCSLNVFLDAEGITPYDGARIISESAEHFPAENIGVMKVRVAGLEPGSQYFFQTKTSFKRDGSVSLYPEGPPFIEVRTEESSTVVNDDVLAQEIVFGDGKLARGTLLLAKVDQASYPISGWAGDGLPDQWAAINTNNFYDKEEHVNLELQGGEDINLVLFAGCLRFVETQDVIPEETNGIQKLASKAILQNSTCQGLIPRSMPWIPLLLFDD